MEDSVAKALQAEIAKVEKERNSLIKDKAALIAEFSGMNDDQVVNRVKKQMRELMPDAFDILEAIMKSGSSEAVRAACAKYVINTGLTSFMQDEASKASALAEILESLKPDDVKVANKTTNATKATKSKDGE